MITTSISRKAVPLSFSQERIWFGQQGATENTARNQTIAMRRNGPLDLNVLERCLTEMVQRHEILRTTFEAVDGDLLQIVHPAPESFPLRAVDLIAVAPKEADAETLRLAEEDARRPFDLTAGPLVRALLISRSNHHHQLYVTAHPMVLDAVSAYQVFLPEFKKLYQSFSAGQPSSLPEPAAQYADFAIEQRRTLSSQVGSEDLEYWREQLAGNLPASQLPHDRPKPLGEISCRASEQFVMSKELTDRIKRYSAEAGESSYLALLTGVVALLYRYTGLDEIVLGSTSPGRGKQEFGRVMGYFENPLPLRVKLSGNPTFSELHSRVGTAFRDAQAHAIVPFSQILKEIGKDLNDTPLFTVGVSQLPGIPRDNSEWDLYAADLSQGNSATELDFSIETRGGQISGTVSYAGDLFDRESIAALVQHWQNLLAAGCEDPSRQVAKLPILAEDEKNRILHEWNNTRVEYPNVCVNELFEQQAARTPDAPAVVFQGKQLSYRELNAKANQLANYLRTRGIGPEVLVGVSINRSPEMLVGLLAIWKAGGAYIPLDPTYPQERLSEDSSAKLLLTSSKHVHLFASAKDKTILLDTDWPAIAKESSDNFASGATPANLAYVMYTSGSTGKPKGAMILHSGLANYLCWAVKAYGVTAGGSAPVHSSISFDLTVTSMYTPLLAGAHVELLPEDAGAQHLLAALRGRKNRSLVKITPAHLRLLSQELSSSEAVDMTKVFVIGGENLLAESLRLWRDYAPETRLINEYGPTETVVGCCVHQVRPDDPRSGSVPIGRPIANTELYILDRHMNPVPAGVMGELYIGGAGVARGYLNRPDLTKQKFINDPFSGRSGARLYKTGDLARYRKDGMLEFLGRIDNQVKVRGYRIELGEIEATLADHPGVKSCAVLAREDEPGNEQLVGYVVSRESKAPAVEELRQFMRQRLPDYMVPAQFVFLQSFPLTPNGKVDHKALPPPGKRRREAGDSVAQQSASQPSTAGRQGTATVTGADDGVNQKLSQTSAEPQTETERSLATIMAEILNVESVGLNDDFFELGGHSLLAIKLATRVKDELGIDMPLATLFEAPTVAALAKKLRKEEWNPSWSSLVPIRPAGSRPPLFLIHAHGGNVLEYHHLVNGLDPDQPVYAFQSRGLDGTAVNDSSIETIATAYIEELRSFQPQGPYYLAGFCFGGLVALEAALQLTAAGQAVASVIMIQSMHPEAMRFKRETNALQRLWYRIKKQVNLEIENLSNQGPGYLIQRSRRAWDMARTRAAIAFDKMTGKRPSDPSRLSMMYIFESLSIEHKKAMHEYVPRPYSGDVILFRASKQLAGQNSDEFLGWKRVLGGNLDVCEVPGHQQTVLLQPNVSKLAQEFSSRLKTVQLRDRGDS
ncbi:MAG: amino acid adenylation domain-containing protein [Candidatus Acidiferrales bacterium]